MQKRLKRTTRGHIAKAITAVAVMAPAALVIAVALSRKMVLWGVHIGSLSPWIVADAALLGIGLLLHRGEEI